MTRTTRLTAALAGIALCASSALAVPTPIVSVTFGSNNDGLGGFTQSTEAADYEFPASSGDFYTAEEWTTNANSVQNRNQNRGTLNSSLLRSVPLDRASGNAYTVTGDVALTDGYVDDNNRVGFYLFGDDSVLVDTGGGPQKEAGAIGLIFNTDDSSSAGSPGNNVDDDISLQVGIDGGPLSVEVTRTQTTTPYAQDLFGTTVTFSVDIAFVGADILIDASMTADGEVTTIPTLTVLAADYTGDYFGFVTRARARNYDPTPGAPAGTDTGRSLPWVMDYESFSVVQTAVPEPASLALVGLGGLALLSARRR